MKFALCISLWIIPLLTSPLVMDVVSSDDVIRGTDDVMLALLLEANNGDGNGGCGEMTVEGTRIIFAVQWLLQRLNDLQYIPGVTIGLEVGRTCQSLRFDTVLLWKETYIDNTTAIPLLGIIGPQTSASALAIAQYFNYLPEESRIPLISGSASGTQLGNKALYSNFFRVIPSDDAQVKAVVDILTELRWNYIGVIFTDEEYGRAASTVFKRMAQNRSICTPVFESIPEDPTTNTVKEIKGKLDNLAIKGILYFGFPKMLGKFLQATDVDELVDVQVIALFPDGTGLNTSWALNANDEVMNMAKKTLILTPQFKNVSEFQKAWNDGIWENCSHPFDIPWLTDLRDLSTDCSSLKFNERDHMLLPWHFLQATAVFAATAKVLHGNECDSSNPDACEKFLEKARDYTEVIETMKSSITLEFDNITESIGGLTRGDLLGGTNLGFDIFNFMTDDRSQFFLDKVGTHSPGNTTLDSSIKETYKKTAQCPKGRDCLECMPPYSAEASVVVEGDMYMVAVAPVHNHIDKNPIKCGQTREKLGAEFVQAIIFALKEVNKEGGLFKHYLPNETLGAIIMDSCYSGPITKHRLLQLHKGHIYSTTGLYNETWVKEDVLPRIGGYVGGFLSLVSLAMSDILESLDLKTYVHISPISTASSLSDREQHPYFLRLTVPTKSEALALLDMLRHLGATYVQVLYNSKDAWSLDLTKEFESKASHKGICIAQKVDEPVQDDSSAYSDTKAKLHKVLARMVVVIMQYEQSKKVMEKIFGEDNNDNNFLFLGTEAWGSRLQLTQNTYLLKGVITVAEELAEDTNFTSYFKSLDPRQTDNFWLSEFWETNHNCYLDLSFQRNGRYEECAPNYRDSYKQDSWVPYYIQAVYAFAAGVGSTYKEQCKDHVCFAKLGSEKLVTETKKIKLDLFNENKNRTLFNANGDGFNGYKYLQNYYDSEKQVMAYRQIGSWSQGSGLSMTKSLQDLQSALPPDMRPKNYESSCEGSKDCCPQPAESAAELSMPFVPAVVTISLLGVIVIALIVVVIYMCSSRGKLLRALYKQSAHCELHFENSGLSNVTPDWSSSNAPVQEMTSAPPSFAPDRQQAKAYDPTSDYATMADVPQYQLHPPPPPCSVASNGDLSDYLTVVETPKTETKIHHV